MNHWKQHRLWTALLMTALLVMLFGSPSLQLLRSKATEHQVHIKTEHMETDQALHQLRDDIASAKKLSAAMDPAATAFILAPVNRLQTAHSIEQTAAENRLTHVNYTVSPERKVTIDSPGAEPQDLAVSMITVTAEAALDTDAMAFIEQLQHSLPGSLHLRQFDLERTNNKNIAAANLHLTAHWEWLSNSAAGGS